MNAILAKEIGHDKGNKQRSGGITYDRSNFKLAAAAMLLTVMLAGCGAQNGETTAAANGQSCC